MNQYHISKKCKICEKEFQIGLTKYEAAFGSLFSRILKEAECPNCGSKEYQSASSPLLPVDKDTMEKWAFHEDLYFLEQDEDLILADKNNIDLIDHFLQRNDILPNKRGTLLSALCVIIYDKSEGEEEAMEVLLKHKQMLIDARPLIDSYIRKEVYPKLSIKW